MFLFSVAEWQDKVLKKSALTLKKREDDQLRFAFVSAQSRWWILSDYAGGID
jgi:hypothetical protein